MALFGFTAQQIIEEGRVKQWEIDDIRGWTLSCDDDIPTDLTDEQIIHFLLACDKNKSFTQRVIREHYKIKKTYWRYFSDKNVDNDHMRTIFSTSLHAIMPNRTDEDCMVTLYKIPIRAVDFNAYHLLELAAMYMDSIQYDKPTNGLIAIIDLKEIGLMHLAKLRYTPLKCLFSFLQDGIPLKLKHILFVNVFAHMNKLMALISPFMKKEVLEVIRYHYLNDDIKEVYEYVPQKCLPKEYGGYLPCFASIRNETIEKLRSLKAFFEAEEKQWNKK